MYPRFVRYFIQFPAGASELVELALDARLRKTKIIYSDDSSLLFESATSIQSADDLPFAKNVFRVLYDVPRRDVSASLRNLGNVISPSSSRRRGGSIKFRIMFHIDGELASVDPSTRKSLESKLAASIGGVIEPRGGMGTEYWVVGRLDLDRLILAERLPRRTKAEKSKGALSAELSWLLVSATRPQPNDVVIDPFAGSGALIAARLAHPARSIVYNDLSYDPRDPQLSTSLRNNRRVKFLSEDALSLSAIADATVDVVLTDPPWGEHEATVPPYPEFAYAVSRSVSRILKPESGRLVLLINRRNAATMIDALSTERIDTERTASVLVSGHPATVIIGSLRNPSHKSTDKD